MTATYAIVKNSDGDKFIVDNAINNAAGTAFNAGMYADNSAGSSFKVFSTSPVGRKIPSGPVFIATGNRTFVV